MSQRQMIPIVVLFLVALGLPGCLAGETKVSTFEKSFPLTPGQPVSVSFQDTDGDVKFTSAEVPAVELKVWKETDVHDAARAQHLLDEITVDVSQAGNDVRIEVRYPHGHWFSIWPWESQRVRVRSEVILPRECRLTASTSDGDITAGGLKGDVALKTSDGTISLSEAEGRLQARSSDGEIVFRGVRGDVEARTSDGHISIAGVLTGLSLKASDGDVSVQVLPGSRMTSGWEVITSDGDVQVALAPDFSADLWLRSSDGDITCGLPVTIQGKTSGHNWRGTLGTGGPLLSIRTSDGDVTLKSGSDTR